jgi:uncharacterized membrane protein
LGIIELNPFDIVSLGSLFLNGIFWIGISLAFLGSLIYIVALSRGKASIVNPLSGGFSYITIVLLSSLALGELITIQKIIGMGIIVFGIYLLSIFYQEPESCESPIENGNIKEETTNDSGN